MIKSTFKAVIEDILSVPAGTLKESDTRDTVEEWSSLADVEILTVVSSELAIEPDEELMSYVSIGDLLTILEERGALSA